MEGREEGGRRRMRTSGEDEAEVGQSAGEAGRPREQKRKEPESKRGG